LRIIEAIIAGERDPKQLAALCSTRIKASRETVAKSLHGSWDEALLFALKAALETFRFRLLEFNHLRPPTTGHQTANI
jgi:transposase